MICDICKTAVVLVSALLTLTDGRPGIFESNHGLSLGSYSGGGGNGYGGESYGGEGLGSYVNDHNSLDSHQGGNSDGGDYHHGVSVVSIGNQKGQTFDLTKHGGGDGHSGLYGGSFVAGKYEASGEEGYQGGQGHYTSIGGYGDQNEHSALLAASLSSSGHSGFEGSHSY